VRARFAVYAAYGATAELLFASSWHDEEATLLPLAAWPASSAKSGAAALEWEAAARNPDWR
jgi:hypothetical protein